MPRRWNVHRMTRLQLRKFCAMAPVILSLLAGAWALANAATGARPGDDEGLGFHVFWLLILLQVPLIAGYVVTADWRRRTAAAGTLALQLFALVLAFAPVAFFRL